MQALHVGLPSMCNSPDSIPPLVQAMDRDGNGLLDTAEFRDAMEKLGMSNITGTTVSTILTAMNIHGPITMDEFMQIIEVCLVHASQGLLN